MSIFLEPRHDYTQGSLRRHDLTPEPLDLFDRWLQHAIAANLPDATAMSVATVDGQDQPCQRLVLLKRYDQQGFLFYTNLQSRKATQLATAPRASLLFPWQALDRQVIITGRAEPLDRDTVLAYFRTRPRDSQLAAWASPQSKPIPSRDTLTEQFKVYEQRFSHQAVPLPEYWGGFLVRAETFEFWQGGRDRLHDRFLYQRRDNDWQIDRLAP
jgi:pyridoxamine 5'-phosphate oxidase